MAGTCYFWQPVPQSPRINTTTSFHSLLHNGWWREQSKPKTVQSAGEYKQRRQASQVWRDKNNGGNPWKSKLLSGIFISRFPNEANSFWSWQSKGTPPMPPPPKKYGPNKALLRDSLNKALFIWGGVTFGGLPGYP